MIKMVYDRGLFCPQVFCDHCGERIETAEDGNAEYEVGDNPCVQAASWPIVFTHKKCCWPLEQSHGGRGDWFASELRDFLIYLANNLAFTEEDRRERAEILQEFPL